MFSVCSKKTHKEKGIQRRVNPALDARKLSLPGEIIKVDIKRHSKQSEPELNKSEILKSQLEVLRHGDDYNERMQAYNKLMQEKPQRSTTWERLIGKSKEIEARNRKLSQMQAQTTKPDFNPYIRLNERSFLKITKFSPQMAEWRRRRETRKYLCQKQMRSRTKKRNVQVIYLFF